MRTSVIPGFGDVAGLVHYVAANPHLFISSSTVMTSALIALIVVVSTAALWSERAARLRSALAPALVLVLAYFGAGSMALAAFLYVRLHHILALESEIQLVSGIGHLAVALVGIVALASALKGRTAREWQLANLYATSYWILQVAVVRPPWFEFQDHGMITRSIAFALLGASALFSVALLGRRPMARRPA